MEIYGALNETAKTLKLCKCFVERILKRGEVRASKRGKHERRPNFGKVNDFWRNLIRETIYSLYKKNRSICCCYLWETERDICWNELWILLRTNHFVSFAKKPWFLTSKNRWSKGNYGEAQNSCLEVGIFGKNWKISSRKLCNCLLRCNMDWFSWHRKNDLIKQHSKIFPFSTTV